MRARRRAGEGRGGRECDWSAGRRLRRTRAYNQSLTVCPQARWRGFQMKPIGHGGRGRVVTGHSFQTLAPVPQPSTTHAPEIVEWHPGPQLAAAAAGMKLERIAANRITCVFMHAPPEPQSAQYSTSSAFAGSAAANGTGQPIARALRAPRQAQRSQCGWMAWKRCTETARAVTRCLQPTQIRRPLA